MPAYLIAEVSVENQEGYGAYAKQTPGCIAEFGGRFLVRGGKTLSKEGAAPTRIVVVEFPDMARAKAFYDSESYQAILPIRQANASSRLFFVEGFGD